MSVLCSLVSASLFSGVRILTTKTTNPDGSVSEKRQIFKDGILMPDDFDLSAYSILSPTDSEQAFASHVSVSSSPSQPAFSSLPSNPVTAGDDEDPFAHLPAADMR